jgi:hypothetical protein
MKNHYRKNKSFLIIFSLINTLFLSSCTNSNEQINSTNITEGTTTISEIVENSSTSDIYTVYIKELTDYQPYLLLTDNYNDTGLCLLLRKFVLDNLYVFNESTYPISKYDGSVLDNFVSDDFIQVFDPDFIKRIQEVSIETINSEEIGKVNPTTVQIKRKIFILSFTEVGMSNTTTEATEGYALPYFSQANSRIAYNDKGTPASWWTRTAHNWGGDQAIGVGTDGTVGNGATTSKNGVRPAFCLLPSTNIKERSDIVNGTTVYAIE